MDIIYCAASNGQGYRIAAEGGNYFILKGTARINEATISLFPGFYKKDAHYCGYINIAYPGNIFVYTADGGVTELDRQTVSDLVEIIQHYEKQNKAAELLVN